MYLVYYNYFTSAEHVRKLVGGFGKKSCVSTENARKHMCVTDRHDMTLAVKVALNPNITNQLTTAIQMQGLNAMLQPWSERIRKKRMSVWIMQ